MARQYFMPNSEDGKAAAFEQFRDNIGPYVAELGLAAADITQQAADATYFRGVLNLAKTMSAAGPQGTAWKGVVLTGTIGAEPTLPSKPAGFPPAVPAGILTRFLVLAREAKNSKTYTIPIGEILGLEGSAASRPRYGHDPARSGRANRRQHRRHSLGLGRLQRLPRYL